MVFRFFITFSLLFFNYNKVNSTNIDSLKKALAFANTKETTVIFNNLGFEYMYIDSDSALFYASKGVEMASKNGYKILKGDGLNTIGCIYIQRSEYVKALNRFIEAERIFENEGHLKGKCQTATNIGIVYEHQNLLEKALDQYKIALAITKKFGNEDFQAQVLNHLGSLYYTQNNKIKALESFENALQIHKQINNIPRIMECLNNIAVIHQELGKYNEALQNFNTDLEYARKMNIKTDIIAILHNMGLVYKDQKDYVNAINYIDSATLIAEEIRDFDDLREAYSSLSEIYKEQHNYSRALEFFQLSAAAKDSLLKQTRDRQFIEMSTKYETEKKDAENKLLKAEGEKQKTILLAISGGLILVGALSFFIYRGYRQKKKANVLLAQQNQEIREQKHIIEEKQTEILDSITYARRLQDAILPPLSLLNQHFNIFVFYQPKDIVAGDFYWFEKKDDALFIAAADCTGHGVPGAMVSVVCSNALNRAVHEFNLNDPGKILDKTRELVLETFAKSERDVKDGMDISLVSLQVASPLESDGEVRLSWAGANNPVYIISQGMFRELKGNKFPVGAFIDDRINNFTSHTLDLKKGDRIFIFSDGMPDQFGGPKNKKYKYKRLQENLITSSQLSISEQKNFMRKDLMEWQGTREQVDDILLIGFEV